MGQRTFGHTSYSPRTAELTFLTNDSGEFYEKLFHLDPNTLNATVYEDLHVFLHASWALIA
jgi:hypothetical protein